ncbi:MAG: hypothetical protein QM755_21585 [Luteolibacter sp.]
MNPCNDQDRSVKAQFVASMGVLPTDSDRIVDGDPSEFNQEWMVRARERVRNFRRATLCPHVSRLQWLVAEGSGFLVAALIGGSFFYLCNRLIGPELRVFAVMAAMAAITLTLAYQSASWAKARITGRFLHQRRP